MKAISVFTLVLVLSACSAAVHGDTASDANSRPTTKVEVPTTSEPAVGPDSVTWVLVDESELVERLRLLSGQDDGSGGGEGTVPSAPAPDDVPRTTSHPVEVVPSTTRAPVVGEVPSGLLQAVVADAVARTSAAESDIEIVRAESVVWNDGSLGCPEPGAMYTQALVQGYWVVLEHADSEYDYRATDTGYFLLCTSSAALGPPS